jgi:hypothetical protein
MNPAKAMSGRGTRPYIERAPDPHRVGMPQPSTCFTGWLRTNQTSSAGPTQAAAGIITLGEPRKLRSTKAASTPARRRAGAGREKRVFTELAFG